MSRPEELQSILDVANATGEIAYSSSCALFLTWTQKKRLLSSAWFFLCLWTGVILDPVYSGKAFHGFLKDMQANPAEWDGRKVLFLHTGGLLGMYSEAAELQALLEKQGKAHRLDVTTIST